MKMPVSMMVYLIEKLIEDKKTFLITSISMDLRFHFKYSEDFSQWVVKIYLGTSEYSSPLSTSLLSISFFDNLHVQRRYADHPMDSSRSYDILEFMMHSAGSPSLSMPSSTLSIWEESPDLEIDE